MLQGNKIVILGDSDVGKTSLVQRLISGIFFEFVGSTIGASYHTLEYNGISLDIWDTAGQEKYRSICPLYYRDAKIAVIVFDVTNLKSYQSVKYWLKELRYAGNYKIYIVGNKCDMENKIGSRDDENIWYTSAKNAIGISELFDDITEYIKTECTKEKEKDVVILTDTPKTYTCCNL